MPADEKTVQDILRRMARLDDARDLFAELNYAPAHDVLPRRDWGEAARAALAEDPQVIAAHGDFQVIYCRLDHPRLPRAAERPVVNRLLQQHPYALFLFSNGSQSEWHFLNVKYDQDAGRRRLFRRITVGCDERLRTATERIARLDLERVQPGLRHIPPLTIQAAHDDAFDVEAVTKQFFREIANWYFWALKHIRFPKDAPKEADGHDHISVIRLITRLIFCWFVKEKGLIPEALFDERALPQTLNGFAPDKDSDKSSVFYRAILQNLFFATLDTEMDKRGWAREGQNFMAHCVYRHKECFRRPSEALGLFKNIPFLNGGLFECLDKDLGEGANPRYVRIDGFSRRPDSQPVVPDFLFFGADREVDLSADYGDAKSKRVTVGGLVRTFNHYRFTITENTPLDQEVALDPELSGKVFENLLAAYNPETGASARKQTGSFYTPREIVSYMVDEALIACLKTKLEAAVPSAKDMEPRLRHLFAYDDEPHQFTPPEVDSLIAAIDSLKALDPAVGSGAFPMGILQRLVFILGKLDPRNESWKGRQIQRIRDAIVTAERIEDGALRERSVRELEQQIGSVNEAFEHNELNYGRKLYLIENCIYGVDIQPIAVQIAKMRFFISLIVDQKTDPDPPNLDVRPLPNLETKFVAANTLIGVKRVGQQLLRNVEIDAKEGELRRVRERHFNARTPSSKAKCREQDAKLRAEIAEMLKGDGWDTSTALKLASWDPYDQNASAGFFDPEWMFGLSGGFDVAMGNPPYVRIQTLNQTDAEQAAWLRGHYASAQKGNYDLYVVFVERGLQLLAPHGQLAYILPHKFFNAQYGHPLRELLAKGRHLRHVVHFGDQQIFPGATNYVCLLFLARAGADKCRWVRAEDLPAWLAGGAAAEANLPVARVTAAEWNFAVGSGSGLFEKLQRMPVRMKDIAARISQGIRTSANEVYVLDVRAERSGLITAYSEHLDQEVVVERKAVLSFLQGREIKAYCISPSGKVVLMPYTLATGKMVLMAPDDFRGEFPRAWEYLSANKEHLENREEGRARHGRWYGFIYPKNLQVMLTPKILVPDIADRAAFALDEKGDFAFTSGYGITMKPGIRLSPEFLLTLLNSRLLDFYWKKVSTPLRGGFYRYFTQFIEQLPIAPIDFGDAASRAAHDALAGLAERVLASKRADPAADTLGPEREIDRRVYALYGLTADEIKLVEEFGAMTMLLALATSSPWKGLPIVPLPMEGQMEIVKLVDAILGEFKRHGYPLPEEAAGRVAALEREVDERVAALYGVSSPEKGRT